MTASCIAAPPCAAISVATSIGIRSRRAGTARATVRNSASMAQFSMHRRFIRSRRSKPKEPATPSCAVPPTEQHVHSFLESLPLMGLLVIITLHWRQFLALFGLGGETAQFGLRIKEGPPSWLYVTVMLSLVLLFEILPYLEELARAYAFARHQGGRKRRS